MTDGPGTALAATETEVVVDNGLAVYAMPLLDHLCTRARDSTGAVLPHLSVSAQNFWLTAFWADIHEVRKPKHDLTPEYKEMVLISLPARLYGKEVYDKYPDLRQLLLTAPTIIERAGLPESADA